MQYADIIVDISSESLDRTYQYSIPPEYNNTAVPGAPVLIPFGRGNRTIHGYIIALCEKPKIHVDAIKPIIKVESDRTNIESQFISLAAYMKEQFGGTMNDALKTVLPVKKKVQQIEQKTVSLLCSKEEAFELIERFRAKGHSVKARLLSELLTMGPLDFQYMIKDLHISRDSIKRMSESGWIQIESKTTYRNPIVRRPMDTKKITINEEQEKAIAQIVADQKQGFSKTYLLHGKTGSGKTEVYLAVIEEVIRQGKQVIVLIPEIALTFQTAERFYHRFGDRVSIMNSRLSAGERYDQNLRAQTGEVDIMIGPRSALFTPFQHLGLIIIDEEHESSYKSEAVPKYHARELALWRANKVGASVVLGSATPSLESYQKAITSSYQLLKLTKRAGDAISPLVHIVDLREELKNKNKSILSSKLQKMMEERLHAKEQILLFLNRRGYAGFVSCRSCGNALKCPHCDVSLTAHADGSLVCHYCGYTKEKPKHCPICGSPYIAAFGTGTQKVEEMVKKRFPNARVLRMDADTTKNKHGHEEILSAFSRHEADILIGTQMIVKGHDFSAVTLVGILAADLSLYSGDYRAAEKTFQLVAQAAGRAGRGKLPGEVVIQTYQPEHYSITLAAKEDYEAFYQMEMNFRNVMQYPPAAHMLVALILGKDNEHLQEVSSLLAKAAVCFEPEIVVIGPASATVSKANDVYRATVYFKHKEYQHLINLKDYLEEYEKNSEVFKGIGIQYDFNPMSNY